jgi:hypothetical protein
MDYDQISSITSRVLFALTFVLLAASVLERIARIFGASLVPGYDAARLLEIAVAFAIFVAVLLLRQIREELRKPGT